MVKNIIVDISLDGGLLCLDFINSVSNRTGNNQQEYLNDIIDLITWAKRLNIIDTKIERILLKKSTKHTREATAFFKQAIEFREIIYKVFEAYTKRKRIRPEVLNKYNLQLKKYFTVLEIKQSANGFAEAWVLTDDNFKRLIAPVLNDSYELLMSDKLLKVKQCPNCGWLFYDSTKNGKRRWCSMKSCGSNVKALEWYYRQKLVEL